MTDLYTHKGKKVAAKHRHTLMIVSESLVM